MINSISSNSSVQSSYSSNNSSRIPEVPDDLLTSGQSGLGSSSLEQKIMELARRDAAAGENSKFGGKYGSGTDEWQKLQNDYISLASPDRKGIIANTLSSLANKMGSAGIKYNRMNFFQMLFQNSWLSKDIHGNFVDFRDAGGNVVARYSEHQGWMAFATPNEIARMQEFPAMWDKAIAAANSEVKNATPASEMAGKMIIPL